MIELKNKELEAILLLISTYSAPEEGKIQKLVAGLLSENITLGTKRKLSALHKEIYAAYKQFMLDIEEIKKEFQGKDNPEDFKKELEELFNEDVKIKADRIPFAQIENISTTANYNFDLIDKITI